MVSPRSKCLAICLVAYATLSHAGCASYQAMPLEPLNPEFHRSAQTVAGVTACIEVFDAGKSKRHFNSDLIKSGFQPIQITMRNDTKRYLELHHSRISVSGADATGVAQQSHFNTAGRATAYGVAGIFIWPLLIPAIVDGTGSARANGQMDADFQAKALKDQVIMPFGTANGVLFVPTSQVLSNIGIRLIDRDSGSGFWFRWTDGTPVEAELEPAESQVEQTGPG